MYNPETEAWIKGHLASKNPADRAAVDNLRRVPSRTWATKNFSSLNRPKSPGGGRYTGRVPSKYAPVAQRALQQRQAAKIRKSAVPAYNMGKNVGAKIFAANREMTAKQRAVAKAAYAHKQRRR